MKLYCIYDRKGELMNPPFVQQNNAMAIRQFQIMVNQPSTSERSNIIHDYHEDFVLMYLGEFDDKTCEFSPQNPTLLLSTATELLTPPRRVLKCSYKVRLPAFQCCGIILTRQVVISQRN
jgi:hypothetical protein